MHIDLYSIHALNKRERLKNFEKGNEMIWPTDWMGARMGEGWQMGALEIMKLTCNEVEGVEIRRNWLKSAIQICPSRFCLSLSSLSRLQIWISGQILIECLDAERQNAKTRGKHSNDQIWCFHHTYEESEPQKDQRFPSEFLDLLVEGGKTRTCFSTFSFLGSFYHSHPTSCITGLSWKKNKGNFNILRTLKVLIVLKIIYEITSSSWTFCTILIVFSAVLRSPKRAHPVVWVFLLSGFELMMRLRHHSRVVNLGFITPLFPSCPSWISTQNHLWGRTLKNGIVSDILRKMKNKSSNTSRPDRLD